MKIIVNSTVVLITLLSSALWADVDPAQYKIVKKTITEVVSASSEKGRNFDRSLLEQTGVDPIENAGKVISVAKDMVALGEDVYSLVIKGKPTVTTSYAPISVVPKNGSEIVDVLDMEGWTVPVTKTYEVKFHNAYNVAVVVFRYSVVYSYKGSYNEKGAYLTAVQVIPDRVRTLFGFDFTATMKLGGIQNQGTKASPVAGALILIEYTVSSFINKENNVDKFFVTGNGQFKRY